MHKFLQYENESMHGTLWVANKAPNQPSNQPTNQAQVDAHDFKTLTTTKKCKIKEPSSWQIPKSSTVACFRRGMLGAGASRVSFNSWEMRRLRFPLGGKRVLARKPNLGAISGFCPAQVCGALHFLGIHGPCIFLDMRDLHKKRLCLCHVFYTDTAQAKNSKEAEKCRSYLAQKMTQIHI